MTSPVYTRLIQHKKQQWALYYSGPGSILSLNYFLVVLELDYSTCSRTNFFRNSVTILTDWVKSGWTEKRDDLVKPYSHHHLGITTDLLRYHNYLWCHRCHLDSWHSVFHLWNFKNTSSKNNITVFTFFLWQTDNLGWSGKYLPEKSLKLTLNRTFIILRLYLIKY